MSLARSCSILVVLIPFSVAVAANAQGPPASDPQAAAIAAQSMAALTGGNQISDITLSGNVTLIAGSDNETGTVTLKALGTGESRMDLTLTGGSRREIRDASAGAAGQWTDVNGNTHDFAFHNCLTDPVWFFPALTSLSAGSNVVLSYVGAETWWNGTPVQHLHSYVYDGSSLTPQLSAMDFYLDSSTLLPVAIIFDAHPDDDSSSDIPIEIDFSSYQTIGGVLVPGRIQRYLNRELTLDITVSGAALNTGLPLSTFALN